MLKSLGWSLQPPEEKTGGWWWWTVAKSGPTETEAETWRKAHQDGHKTIKTYLLEGWDNGSSSIQEFKEFGALLWKSAMELCEQGDAERESEWNEIEVALDEANKAEGWW